MFNGPGILTLYNVTVQPTLRAADHTKNFTGNHGGVPLKSKGGPILVTL